MALSEYYLGCPIWAKKEWVGELFTPNARPADFLRQYASVFNAVEGNTTFYALPSKKSVEKWLDETPPAFRFCFKFPRLISHEKKLQNALAESFSFLELLRPLQSRLGPFFLQLPASFSPRSLHTLKEFLASLPADFHYAVELRDPDFFDGSATEAELSQFLQELQIDRVTFDTRALHAAQSDDPFVKNAQRRKPKVPVRFEAIGMRPIVRFVGDFTFEPMMRQLSEWAAVFAKWIDEGKTPYMFVHSPDDFHAPRIARIFNNLLTERCEAVGTLPAWPAGMDEKNPSQLDLLR